MKISFSFWAELKAQRVDYVATLLTTNVNLTHTSKTRQVKRTQMVACGRFTVRAFVIFFKLLRIEVRTQVATKRSRESMWD